MVADIPAEKLFPNRLTAFLEVFGSAQAQTPAAAAAFADDRDGFVVLYPERRRLYRYDVLGGLTRKTTTDSAGPQTPVSVAWSDEPAGFLVGFDTGRVWRFTPDLEAVREHSTVSDGLVPRHLAAAGPARYAADGTVVIRFGAAGPARVELPGPIGRLLYAEPIDLLLAALPGRVVALTRALDRAWEVAHPGGPAVVGCGPDGDVWMALSTGRLWRLTGADRTRAGDAATAPEPTGLVVLEGAVVVGGRGGRLVVHDPTGRPLGGDDLLTAVNGLAAGGGNCLVAATDRGPSVLQPHPDLLRRAAGDAREAARTVDDWVRRWAGGDREARTHRPLLDAVDLADWPRVLALQAAFRDRAQADTAARQLVSRLRALDPNKADYLFPTKPTRPVFIDGSNVARSHWQGPPNPAQRSRLAALLAVRDKLAEYRNPTLYPVITVVDSTERHRSDMPDRLVQLIGDGVIEETPTKREADALILNRIRDRRWYDCQIVTNDKRLYEAHAEMLPDAPRGWYERVRWAFRVDPRTNEVTIVERSQ